MLPQLNTVLEPLYMYPSPYQKGLCLSVGVEEYMDCTFIWEPWMYRKSRVPFTISKELEEFLRANGAYTRAMKNMEKYWLNKGFQVSRRDKFETLVGMFWWEATPEGWDYWNRLSEIYETFIKDQLNKPEKETEIEF